MAAPASAYKDRQFLAVIGDEDSVTGLLLAGVGVSFTPLCHANCKLHPLLGHQGLTFPAISMSHRRRTTRRTSLSLTARPRRPLSRPRSTSSPRSGRTLPSCSSTSMYNSQIPLR
ncbi:hypothetical protein MPH_12753 [Macrophomina phaseolina MS6]|uniref:Uncharacterized protein n=1 Tax=Macrophomina phaseolina (strain MS6) TaxID=1126212 RepID=K2R7A5_MACPH|nr:hypothetical protein MPH_12753 [Macrophomina phaseolina MS6]